jgi:hypothetical protein
MSNSVVISTNQSDCLIVESRHTARAAKVREYQKRYYAANVDKFREYQKQHYAENAEKIRAQKKRYHAVNAAKIREKQKLYRAANAEKAREYQKQYRAVNADKLREQKQQYRDAHPEKIRKLKRQSYAAIVDKDPKKAWLMKAFNAARARAKRRGLPYDEEFPDLELPDTCPVLGIALRYPDGNGKNKRSANSPSLDRINPLLGYVASNLRVISFRANTLKNDAAVAELEAVIRYMKYV